MHRASKRSIRAVAVLILTGWLMTAAPLYGQQKKPTAEQLRFFEMQVRPLLVQHCYKCHGSKKQSGGLRLDSLAAQMTGGDSGPAVSPGKPDESLIIDAVNYESLEMPPDGKLSEKQIAVLTNWVKIGAPWTPGESVPSIQKEKITAEDRAFWSFQPLAKVTPPQVDDSGWSKNEIDRFIYRRLKAEGLSPADEASKRVLIRRATFDLIGLPPTPAEVDAFLADNSPTAYENLIDRLLKSPRYGERWGRHWLDLVRYAESDGYRQDAYRPHAWRYRDYVIKAFNEDKPYDRFVAEQLAGDEIAPHDPQALAATGLLRLWIYEFNQRDVRTQWDGIINDVTDVTGDVFLGLGMGCARCHDHKFDPILKEDYFRLRAFFAPLLPRDDVPFATSQQREQYQQKLARWEEKTADIRKQLDALALPFVEPVERAAINKFPPDIRVMFDKPYSERTSLEKQLVAMAQRQLGLETAKLKIGDKLKGDKKKKWDELTKQLAQFAKEKPSPLPVVYTVTDVDNSGPPTRIPGRKQEIAPGFLTVIDDRSADLKSPPTGAVSTGRRTALAQWLTSPDNPLTSRVIVNRVWQYHFGQGLVPTSSDFGHLGQPPSHPELLDYLAGRFVDEGWSFKKLHRSIMTSATYRQNALQTASETARLKDPTNRFLWRMNSRRLDAEQIRDAMLAVSGGLNLTAGGPSVSANQPRRSIYTKAMRNTHAPLLAVFDAPDGFSGVSQRNVTTTPTQSLLMINGPWTLARARAFAFRLKKESGKDRKESIVRAYRLAFSRRPTAEEIAAAEEFFQQQEKQIAAGEKKGDDVWVDFCHVLLNTNEFLYVD